MQASMQTTITETATLILHGCGDDTLQTLIDRIGLNTRDTCGRNLLDCVVLQAVHPLCPAQRNALPVIDALLGAGADASRTLDHIVDLHELCFEATAQATSPYRQAVNHATAIIPHLINAGAVISRDSLDSAKYNCDPRIQKLLEKATVTGDNAQE